MSTLTLVEKDADAGGTLMHFTWEKDAYKLQRNEAAGLLQDKHDEDERETQVDPQKRCGSDVSFRVR